jgi:hypothetical protein
MDVMRNLFRGLWGLKEEKMTIVIKINISYEPKYIYIFFPIIIIAYQ